MWPCPPHSEVGGPHSENDTAEPQHAFEDCCDVPYGVLEERFSCIWAELLGVSPVGVEGLLELGGRATWLKACLDLAQR